MYINEVYPLFVNNIVLDCLLVAEISLYSLAPWIMVGIALWGIGRLCRPGARPEESHAQDEQDWKEPYEDKEDEIDNEYDDYDEQE